MNPDINALPAALKKRVKQFWPDFWHSYHLLYPEAGGNEIQQLLNLLAQAHEDRSAHLKQSDAQRAKQPDWFQTPRHIGMMLYVHLFSGDLTSLIEHIPYFKELGITYLHLMPLLRPRQGPNDGGYAVADYRDVDPRIGTLEDLRRLAKLLQEQDIALVVDLVMNHTAREHAWAQAALNGDAGYQQYYFLFDDRSLPDAYERNLPEVFPDFAPGNFTFLPEIEKWAWTTFYDFQWDLNYRNPQVFAAMLGEMLFLANCGVDILRLDAVPFLWKKMGTNSQNQPEAIHLLAAYRALVRMVAPGVLFKSEAIVASDDVIKYLGAGGLEGKVCEVGYNATLMNHLWHALASENTHLLRTTLLHLPAIPQEATWLNYIRCHDDIGWGISDENAAAVQQDGRGTRNFCTDFYTGAIPGSYAEGYVFQRDRNTGEARVSGTAAALTGLQKAQVEAEPEQIQAAIRRLRLLNGIIFFMRGIPLIYSGDETGQLNDFTYLADPERAGDNRWVHRPPMNWHKASLRSREGSVEQQLFDIHAQFAKTRAGQKALHGRSSDRILLPDNDSLFFCERSYAGERLLLVANFSRKIQAGAISLLPPEWRSSIYKDVLSGTMLRFTNNELIVPPYGVYWLQPAKQAQPAALQKIRLRVHVHTEFGETVFLTGSNEALGAWRLQYAVPADADAYPWWTAEIEAPQGEAFAYRWVRMHNREVVHAGEERFYYMVE